MIFSDGFLAMRLSASILCFSLLLLPSSVSAAKEVSYAQQIDAAYKEWSKTPSSSETITRTSDPNVEAFQLRATLMMGTDVRQETKFKLLKRLSDIEKSSGANSMKLVPILLQLAALPGLEDGLRNLQRAISIANSAPLTPDKQSDNAAAAEWLHLAASPDTFFVVAGGRDSGSAILTDDLRESMLKTSFKLGLRVAGINDDVLNTLIDLCEMYRKQKHADELVAIGRSTLNAFSSTNTDRVRSMQKKFLDAYRKNLTKLHNQEELDALDKVEADKRMVQCIENLKSSNKQLEQAEKRAEVDPYGLLNSRLRNANALLSTGEKTKAWAQLRQALADYRKMSAANADYDVSRSMWNSFMSALRNAETKADEQIIYELVDAEVEKLSSNKKRNDTRNSVFTSQLSDISRYFMDKHRNDAAIEFLSYTRQKAAKLRPNDNDTYNDVSGQLRQLYERIGETDKAFTVAQEQVDSLTQQDATTTGYLLDIATYFAQTDKFEQAHSVIDRAIAIMQTNPDSFRKKPTLFRIQHLAQAYERKKRPQEIDQWVRKMIDVVSKNKSAFASNISWVDDSVRSACKEFVEAGEFENAEALIEYAQSSLQDVSDDLAFSRELASIYLKHAGKLQSEGKKSRAKKFLSLSDEQFNRMLSKYTTANSIDQQKQYRQAELKKYGFIEQSGK